MNSQTLCKDCGAPNSPSASFCTQCGASMRDAPIRKQRRLKKRHVLGGFIVLILFAAIIAAVTPNNTTNTTELVTSTPKATTTPMAAPSHDALLSKFLDAYYNASNIGATVTAWQVTWLSGNSVKLQKSTISSTYGKNVKLTETDVITRFASASEASNYVQSRQGTAAYQKTLTGPFYAECWAYKQLTGQQPTTCINYDTSKSGSGNANGKAITQSNEIVNTSDYVSVVV